MLSRTRQIVRSGNLLETDVDGEIVALNIEKGQCYGMDKVASRIWELLAEPISISALCERLAEEYEVDSSTCDSDVMNFVDHLHGEGLVRYAEEQAA